MKRHVAIYAHFSHDSKFSASDKAIIGLLSKHFYKVIVVSTSIAPNSIPKISKNVQVISRINFGYDFVSYKIGLAELGSLQQLAGVFFINSSIEITNIDLFEKTIIKTKALAARTGVVGLTKSHQIRTHLQSYWLMVSTDTLAKQNIRDFWNSVGPLDSKLEIIKTFEIGISKEIRSAGVRLSAIYNPNFILVALENLILNLRIKLRQTREGLGNTSSHSGRVQISNTKLWEIFRPNLTHLRARDISKKFGIAKKEVLFANPLGISLGKDLNLYSEELSPKPTQTSKQSVKIKLGSFRQTQDAIAVCIHVYHRESLVEISRKLQNIACDLDVFVSTSKEGLLAAIVEELSPICSGLEISLVENRGRDVGPFLALLNSQKLEDYEIGLKLHTKKSDHSEKGIEWRDRILHGLIGSPSLVSKVLSDMFNNSKIGVLAPKELYLSNPKYDGVNKRFLAKISKELGFKLFGKPFVAGTMFWFRPRAFSALNSHPEISEWFEAEMGQVDSTCAHALERSFSEIAVHAGFLSSTFEAPNRQISIKEVSRNTIPTF